jgi:hypothetical protein
MYTLMLYFSCTVLVHCNILNEFKISACIWEVLVLNFDCNTAVLKGHAIAWIISHQFVTLETWVQSQSRTCGIGSGLSDTVTGFALKYFIFPIYDYFNSALYLPLCR